MGLALGWRNREVARMRVRMVERGEGIAFSAARFLGKGKEMRSHRGGRSEEMGMGTR